MESIEHLDFAITCAIVIEFLREKPRRCGEPAEWIGTCRKCGKAAPACSMHRQLVWSMPMATCLSCGVTGPGLVIFAFEPLAGGNS